MKRLFLIVVAVIVVSACGPTTVYAQVAPEKPASYEIRVFAAGVNPSTGQPVKAALMVPFASVTCGLAQATPPSGTLVNPKVVQFTDPADVTKDCQILDQAYFWSLPIGAGYVTTLTAVSASGQKLTSAPTSPFDIAGLPMVGPSRVTMRP